MNNIINIALSGIKAASSAIGSESHNIANTRTEGYTRKNVTASAQVLNGHGSGVAVSIPHRLVDSAIISQEREIISSSAYFAGKSKALDRIQNNLGTPGDQNSLGEIIKDFSSRCQSLSLDATNGMKRKDLLSGLGDVTRELSRLTDQIQTHRRTCDTAIKGAVDEVNANIKSVDSLNKLIISNKRAGLPADDLVDQRDQAIREISKHMNIVVTENTNGGVFLQTGQGVSLLFPDVALIHFTPTTYIDASSSYDPIAGNSDINHITVTDSAGNPLNITEHFTGGDIAAHIEMRDTFFPNLQEQLDRLATDLRDKINADHNLGTGYPPATTLTGTRSFADPAADMFNGAGTIRLAVVDKATGQFVGAPPYDLDLGALGGATINALAANLDAGIGGSATVDVTPDGQLRLTAANPDHGIALVSVGGPATETGTGLGFSHYFGLNNLITSEDEVFAAGAIVPGIAGRLSIRPDIVSQDVLLSRGMLNDALPTPAIGDQAINNGDSRTMGRLAATMEAHQDFVDAGGLGPRRVSFSDYGSVIVADCTQIATTVDRLQKGEQSALANIQHAHGQISGTDSQESLMNVLAWQQVHMGCLNVVGVVRENLNSLMEIV
tara:strand:- start:439 stop:2268 length:1830 start_codon:yes stop_codon:yes gene_type:complete